MPVELIAEEGLYDALRPFRPDRAAFERGVTDYLRGRAALAEQDPLRDLPPLARAAAAVLPLPLLTGGKVSSGGAVSSGGIGQKLLGIALFPAVSLFMLLGATVLSVMGLRGTKFGPSAKLGSPQEYDTALQSWWREHWLPAILLYVGMLTLMFFNITGWFFPLLIASFGLLVAVVRSLARRGLGNRYMLAGALATPLILIGQLGMSFNLGDGEIHLLDPKVVGYVFWFGLFCLGFIALRIPFGQGRINRNAGMLILCAMYFPIALLLLTQLRLPPSTQAIVQHVETFAHAPSNSSTWRQWEIPARWTIEEGLRPNLKAPRKLFEQELAGEQNFYIVGIAFRVGLAQPADIPKLRDLDQKAGWLLDRGRKGKPILSLDSEEWVIRALVLSNQLDDADRDFLAARLHATMYRALEATYDSLGEVLLVTQLLQAIDRPIEPEKFRDQVHALLVSLHCTDTGGFRRAGGFKPYTKASVSDDDATECAVELMQIYGVPAGLDLNWVRSYAKPRLVGFGKPDWTSAITRERLAALPGAEPPTMWQWLYYERSLIAAVILVALCLYAVWISPVVVPSGATAGLPSSVPP